MIRIPDLVETVARANGHDDWLASLPDRVDDLARRWSLTVGDSYDGGTASLVVAVTRPDGSDAALKLAMPMEWGIDHPEVVALRIADGAGLVRLFDFDEEHAAMLLERLGPPLSSFGLPLEERHRILCETGLRLWRPAPGAPLPSGAQKAQWLIEFIVEQWESQGRPCSERAVTYALQCAERRIAAHDDERAVLAHGDLHQWNTLQAGDAWKLIDPGPLLSEPEYDLGIILREDPEAFMTGDPMDLARALAAHTGLDAVAAWEWGVVERVSTALACLFDGIEKEGRAMLAAAERVAELDGT